VAATARRHGLSTEGVCLTTKWGLVPVEIAMSWTGPRKGSQAVRAISDGTRRGRRHFGGPRKWCARTADRSGAKQRDGSERQPRLPHIHLMIGPGTLPSVGKDRMGLLRYRLSGNLHLTGEQMLEPLPEIAEVARVGVDKGNLMTKALMKTCASSHCGPTRCCAPRTSTASSTSRVPTPSRRPAIF
jgi:hypothetical protein